MHSIILSWFCSITIITLTQLNAKDFDPAACSYLRKGLVKSMRNYQALVVFELAT